MKFKSMVNSINEMLNYYNTVLIYEKNFNINTDFFQNFTILFNNPGWMTSTRGRGPNIEMTPGELNMRTYLSASPP